MKRIILHVGLPKTGTTSIQDCLAGTAAELARDGVLFPIVREDLRSAGRAQGVGVGWHRALSMYVSQRPGGLAPGEWDAWRAELRRFAETPALDTLMLSQEGLFGGGRRDRIAALLEELPAGARRIVLVLRPADAWLTSLYEQFVRSVVRTEELPGAFPPALHYAERGFEGMIDRLERHVPGAELQILSFDALVAGDGLIANFAAALELPAWLAERTEAMPRANAGLPQDMVAFLRAANAARVPMPGFVAIRGALARAARRRTAGKQRGRIFPPDFAARIAERFEADRAYVRQRFGIELKAAAPVEDHFPLAADPAALRAECTAFLDADGAAVFDAVAGSFSGFSSSVRGVAPA